MLRKYCNKLSNISLSIQSIALPTAIGLIKPLQTEKQNNLNLAETTAFKVSPII